ncbi:MAG TPA: 3-dehydroquinate synthase [Polyangiaceae bacterium]|nr:3-dehydroquinate synthase [Polyangiaceae bacterium]
MSLYVQRFAVTLDYPVYFTRGVFDPDKPDLAAAVGRKEPARRHRCLFVVEERVAELWPHLLSDIAEYVRAHGDVMQLACPPLIVTGGEACKNDEQAPARLLSEFEAQKMDRHAAVVIVGGGALQDMVGYAAATAHRGLRVVRVPTTVLSQADSGVGVKNGINAFGKKNFLGTFAAPFAVLIDTHFLRTLPADQAVAGMAEAVKVALIKDPSFFTWLLEHAPRLARLEESSLATLIRRCAELHLAHIATSGDPFELGTARPLDFGHWAAHKLESLSAYRLSHGEAVAIGIALDTHYSAETGLISHRDAEQVVSLLEQLGLPLWDDALELETPRGPRVLEGLDEFREHLGGELTVTLLDGLGRGREVHELDEGVIRTSLRWLRERARRPRAATA